MKHRIFRIIIGLCLSPPPLPFLVEVTVKRARFDARAEQSVCTCSGGLIRAND